MAQFFYTAWAVRDILRRRMNSAAIEAKQTLPSSHYVPWFMFYGYAALGHGPATPSSSSVQAALLLNEFSRPAVGVKVAHRPCSVGHCYHPRARPKPSRPSPSVVSTTRVALTRSVIVQVSRAAYVAFGLIFPEA
jgi:hypothetical protein